MATHARTPRTIKLLGVPYMTRYASEIDPDGKGDQCPTCKKRNTLELMDEQIQLGFYTDKYYEFTTCKECGANVVVMLTRKADRYDA